VTVAVDDVLSTTMRGQHGRVADLLSLVETSWYVVRHTTTPVLDSKCRGGVHVKGRGVGTLKLPLVPAGTTVFPMTAQLHPSKHSE
jgi:hypothetical protein